jgi:hypothetical protein
MPIAMLHGISKLGKGSNLPGNRIAHRVIRPFVVPQSNEVTMPQMLIRRPLPELDLRDYFRL